jgi:hypothetical protein
MYGAATPECSFAAPSESCVNDAAINLSPSVVPATDQDTAGLTLS